MLKKREIFVTRPTLAPFEDVLPLLKEIWNSRHLTNRGPILQRLEIELASFLGVKHVSLVANATLGCMLALRQAGIGPGDQVVTTPFSFVATAHAIRWLGATPVFADIDDRTLNIDPAAVERAITPATRAILAVHCYATPCDVDALERIARTHGIALLYDAAHAFGAELNGQSLLNHGDLSIVSLHATKVFNTFEGGAIISHDPETKMALDRLANYGSVGETDVNMLGLNAKMSEVHAAFGLAQLPYFRDDIQRRREVAKRYRDALQDVEGIDFVCGTDRDGHNFYAFPIRIGNEYPIGRAVLNTRLRDQGIYARRYFFPLISEFPMYSALPSARPCSLPVATAAAREVLCLPIYPELSSDDQQRVIDIVRAP